MARKQSKQSNPKNEIVRLLQANTGERRLLTVWQEWVEMVALSLRNSCDLHGREEREARYLALAGRYSAEQMGRFAGALGALVQSFETLGYADVLGDTYGQLELTNEGRGQFFTPYSVSRMMAQIALQDVADGVAEKGYITINDPACGGGAMLIAAAEVLKDAGVNYQQQMHATGQDIDPTAVHMTYIQLSLLHVPAMVIQGDTLRQTCVDVWYTPAHILGGWTWRLRERPALGDVIGAIAERLEQAGEAQDGAMTLFDLSDYEARAAVELEEPR